MLAKRRLFVKGVVSIASAIALLPSIVMAAWPKQAFIATTREQVLAELFNEQNIKASDEIQLKLDKRVESGDSVPIEVSTTLKDVQSITLLLNNNPHPLAANIRFEKSAVPFLATRLKLNDSSEVTAIVKTAHGLYSHQEQIRILVGGCH